MENKLSQSALQTKQNIMEAFWKLYEKERIENISVSSICKSAGYNRSTFYVYFRDIYEVLDAIEENIITVEEFKSIVLKNIMNNSGKEEIMTDVVNLYEKWNRYLSVLLGEHGDPAFRTKLLKRIAPVVLSLTKFPVIKNKIRLEYIMEYQSAAVLSIITRWYQRGKDLPIEELIDILICTTMNGVQKEIAKLTNII